jgi:hypothetical protein
VLQLGKEERQKQNPIEINARYKQGFCFTSQSAIECVIGFMIDGRTIKREALVGQFGHLVSLGVGKLCIAYRPSA